MKKILFILISYFSFIVNIFAEGNIRESILPKNWVTPVINTNESGKGLLFSILEYLKESIFGLLALIAITVFIFIGARLVMAKGNPEEFKKALMQFIYAIVGLAIVAISWVAVKLVSSLNF